MKPPPYINVGTQSFSHALFFADPVDEINYFWVHVFQIFLLKKTIDSQFGLG